MVHLNERIQLFEHLPTVALSLVVQEKETRALTILKQLEVPTVVSGKNHMVSAEGHNFFICPF